MRKKRKHKVKENPARIEDNIIYISIPKRKIEFLIDKEDYERVRKMRWYRHSKGYICSSDNKNRKTILLHVFILGKKEGRETDHINMNKLDNRKENLRFVTSQENNFNKIKRKTSLALGVTRNGERYSARIGFNRWFIHLGTYDTVRQASLAYLEAKKDLLLKIKQNA